MAKQRGPVSASDLLAELERDPEYRAQCESRAADVAAHADRRRLDRQPVIEDLRSAGVDVSDTGELYKQPDSYAVAIPVLLAHLRRNYAERVLQDIGQALPFKPDPVWWDDFKHLYLTTRSDAVRDRVAAAMSGCARRAHYEDLLAFIRDPDLGASRIHFLRPINRIGNRIQAGQGRAIIEMIVDDPVMGKEARAIFRGRSRSQ